MLIRNLNWGPGDLGEGSGRAGGQISSTFFWPKIKPRPLMEILTRYTFGGFFLTMTNGLRPYVRGAEHLKTILKNKRTRRLLAWVCSVAPRWAFNRKWRLPAGGLVATGEGNINKWFCLIVFVALFTCVLVHIWDKGNIARSGRCEYESGAGFVVSWLSWFLIWPWMILCQQREWWGTMPGRRRNWKNKKIIILVLSFSPKAYKTPNGIKNI